MGFGEGLGCFCFGDDYCSAVDGFEDSLAAAQGFADSVSSGVFAVVELSAAGVEHGVDFAIAAVSREESKTRYGDQGNACGFAEAFRGAQTYADTGE